MLCILIKLEFQVTTLPNEFPDAHSAINDLRLEYVVAIEGVVRSRPDESINKKMQTGFIEVYIICKGEFHFSIELITIWLPEGFILFNESFIFSNTSPCSLLDIL